MAVSGATSTQNSNATTQVAAAAKKTMGKEDFLKLFTTQLKAQDPLSPMDSAQFTAQLAQFSSLEQLTNINTGLKDLLTLQNSLQNTLTTGMIGKRVRTSDDVVHTVASIGFAQNQTFLSLDDGQVIQMGDIKEILGGN